MCRVNVLHLSKCTGSKIQACPTTIYPAQFLNPILQKMRVVFKSPQITQILFADVSVKQKVQKDLAIAINTIKNLNFV